MSPFDAYRLNLTRRHFLSQGSHLLDGAALNAAQIAAWTMLTNELMNLDEVLNK
jgi:hypothetical protein